MGGFGAVAMGSVSGGLLGLISAFYGGRVDAIIQRFMDALMAIPTLILALAIMAALGQSLFNVIVAVGLVQMPRANRVVRAQAMSVKESEYVPPDGKTTLCVALVDDDGLAFPKSHEYRNIEPIELLNKFSVSFIQRSFALN